MMLIYFLLGIVLIALGIFAIVAPEDYIYMQHCLTMRHVEPSDWYIRFTRVGGGFMVVAGIAMAILSFVIF